MIYKTLMNDRYLIIAVFGLLVLANTVRADNATTDTIHFRGHTPTPKEFVEAFAPNEVPAESPKRGFVSKGIHYVPPQARSDKPKAVSLNDNLVPFAFASYTLTAQAKKVLHNLGIALASPELAKYQFLIEGHTDAVGGSKYNQILSERRAESARRYLLEQFNIESYRLLAAGRGEELLLYPEDPKSEKNRRVTVIRLYRVPGL